MKFKNRQKLLSLMFASMLLTGTGAQAADLENWTLERVLEKVAESNGGKESIEKLTNVRLSGSVETADSSYDFMLLKKRPNKIRMRFMFRGRAMENGYNGRIGWQRSSRGAEEQIAELEGDALLAIRLEADFDGPLIGKHLDGVSLSLEKPERIGRIDYFVVKVSTPLRASFHYIDSRTFRELKVVSHTTGSDGEPRESVNTYDDYKKYDGIWVAHVVHRQLPSGKTETIRIEKVETNPGILDLVFNKPE